MATGNHNRLDQVKQLWLAHYASGHSVTDCHEHAGTTPAQIRQWRSRDPDFAKAYDAVMEQVGENTRRKALLAAESNQIGHTHLNAFIDFRMKMFDFQTFTHHALMADALFKALGEGGGQITMVLAPPESAKTSLTEDAVDYVTAVNPAVRSLVLSESLYHARKVLGTHSRRMQDGTSPFVRKFGPFHNKDMGSSFTADTIRVAKAPTEQRDPTIEARGVGAAIVGGRKDLIVCDDVMSLKNLNQAPEIMRVLRQDIFSRVTRQGAIFIVGTRVGPGDVYELLLDEGLVDYLVQIPAIDENGESYWPEYWTLEELERKRKLVGEEAWWRNFMQQPRSEGAAAFTVEDVERAKDRLRTEEQEPGTGIILSLDPAVGGWAALTALEWGKHHITAIDLERRRDLGKVEGMIEMVDNFAQRYKPVALIIESDTMQKGLANDDRLIALAKRRGFRIIPHRTSGEKADPILGVASMAGSFARGEIRIAWGNDYTRRRLAALESELLHWRPSVDAMGFYKRSSIIQDSVMSLWFGWRWWVIERGNIERRGTVKGRALPWQPTTWQQRKGA